MQNIWHIIKIRTRLFAWNMDSEILSLNRTLSFFFCSCHLHREIARKKAKSGIETSKLCVNKSPLAYTLQRPIQNNNHPSQKGQIRQKKQPKGYENGQKWPKICEKWAKMWLKPLKFAPMGTHRLKYTNWGSFSTYQL